MNLHEDASSTRRGGGKEFYGVTLCYLCLILLAILACGRRTAPSGGRVPGVREHTPGHHRFVGRWEAFNRVQLILLDDHSGSLDTRGCTWKEMDEWSVMVRCEAVLRDDWVLTFDLAQEEGSLLGTLQNWGTFSKIQRSPEGGVETDERFR